MGAKAVPVEARSGRGRAPLAHPAVGPREQDGRDGGEDQRVAGVPGLDGRVDAHGAVRDHLLHAEDLEERVAGGNQQRIADPAQPGGGALLAGFPGEVGAGIEGEAEDQGAGDVHQAERPGLHRIDVERDQMEAGVGDGQAGKQQPVPAGEEPPIGLDDLLVDALGDGLGCLVDGLLGRPGTGIGSVAHGGFTLGCDSGRQAHRPAPDRDAGRWSR